MESRGITQGFTFRHGLIVVAGILIAFGPCALVYNVWSIFVVPVSSELGVAPAQFTFFITLTYLIGGIASPFAGNLLQCIDLRAVLSASVVLVSAGLFGCSIWQDIYLFYLSGVVVGLGIVSLMFLAIPTLINRWFSERTGFFIGLCFAMSGVGGAVWSMVGGLLIDAYSWRMAYCVFGFISLIVGLLATAVLIRSYPSDVGLFPYGASVREEGFALPASEGSSEPDAQPGVSAHGVLRSPVFYFLVVSMGLFNALTVSVNLYAAYIHHLGEIGMAGITPETAVMTASTVASCLMAVSACGKVLLGALTDKSLIGALALACAAGATSILCMWLGCSSVYVVVIGGALGGLLYAAIDALSPSITRQIVGPHDYTIIYSRVAVVVNLTGALAATTFTAVADVSWDIEWAMSLGLIAVAFLCGIVAIRWGKNLKQTHG